MSDKSENILIGYTKWLFKWFAIVCAVIVVGIMGLLGYERYQDQVAPMIAIECTNKKGWDSTNAGGSKTKKHYLVQKKRGRSLPYALYRPSYYKNVITLDTSPDDYWKQYPFDGEKWLEGRTAYSFEPSWSPGGVVKERHWIFRDNLQVFYWAKDDNTKGWIPKRMGKCRQITFDEFYAESKRGLNERKSKLKF